MSNASAPTNPSPVRRARAAPRRRTFASVEPASHPALMLCLTLVACTLSGSASPPDVFGPYAQHPARHAQRLLGGTPDGLSYGAVPHPAWSERLERLSKEGCGEVVDIARAWAAAREFPFEIRARKWSRTGFFDLTELPGYVYVSVHWSPTIVGTAPVAGYMIAFEITLYTAKRLNPRALGQLQRALELDTLVTDVERAARRCGWYSPEE